MQLIDNSNSVYRKGNLIIIAVVYIFSDLIFQGKLSEQFNSFLLNLQQSLLRFLNSGFASISSLFMKYLSLSRKVVTMIWIYLFSFPCMSKVIRHTKRLAKKKETRVTLLSNRIATHSNNFSWDSLWQHVHTYIEFWLVQWTSVSSVIYFGFALTAFDWQPVYGHLCLFIFVLKKMRISKVLTYKP